MSRAWGAGLGARVRVSAVLVVVSMTAGCGSLLETDLPPSTSYVLAPAPAQSTGIARSEVDLSIGRPDLAPGLDTDRIAVLKGRQLDYYRGAQWGGRTTEVVQTLLVDSFEDQQLFHSVTPEQSRVASQYVLDISVRDFQAEYASDNAAPTAHVTIHGRLIRVVDRQLVETFAATAQSKAADNRLGAVAAAFETAAQQVVLELAQKTAAAIAGDAEKLRTARGEKESA